MATSQPLATTALASSSVTEAAFLNSQLASSATSLSNLESTLSNLVTQLSLGTQDLSNSLEDQILRISSGVPRITFDLQLLRENALLLRFTLDAVRKRLHHSTAGGEVIARIRLLDLIKTRLKASLDVLREAESWSTLESEISSLLTESSFLKAGERLQEAGRSLSLFPKETAEWESRKALLVSLQNQLEASVSSELVRKTREKDVKSLKGVKKIFEMMERENEFRGYYFGGRREKVVGFWEEGGGLRDGATGPVDGLTKFFDLLLALINEETSYLPIIFPTQATATLLDFVRTTIETLSPSLAQRVQSAVEGEGEGTAEKEGMDIIIKCYKATEEFALGVERVANKLRDLDGDSAPGGEGITTSSAEHENQHNRRPSHSKRHSSSLSHQSHRRLTSRALSGSGQSLLSTFQPPSSTSDSHGAYQPHPWELALFEPFLDWQSQVRSLERKVLSSTLPTPNNSSPDLDPRRLLDRATHLFSTLDESITNSIALTHGFGAHQLLLLLEEVVGEFFAGLVRNMRALRKTWQSSASEDGGGGGEGDEHPHLEDLEYTSREWGAFAQGLKLLAVSRGLRDKLAHWDGRLKTRLRAVLKSLGGVGVLQTGEIPPGTTRGALALLRVSSLNDAALKGLADRLSSDDGPGADKDKGIFLPKSLSTSRDLTRQTQLFVQDVILSPLQLHLSHYPSLPIWSSPAPHSTSLVSVPEFSLSPTETISKVGEGLFNLPRLFEVYAEDDALAFEVEELPFIEKARLWEFAQVEDEGGHKRGLSTSVAEAGLASPSLSTSGSKRPPPPPQQIPHLSTETVIATWLASLTLSLLSHLTTSILPTISKLSKHGAKQLASDLDYLINVARTLDVEEGEAVDNVRWWKEALESEGRLDSESSAERDWSKGEKEVWDAVAAKLRAMTLAAGPVGRR
ncbi:hypothetical protein T439DRAFT_381067 [Meredithblackwellia eburnea MCA 4105]